MKTLFLGVLLSAGTSVCAQYTHFNLIFENETGSGFDFSYHITQIGDTIESITQSSNDAQLGAKIRSVDVAGSMLENNFYPSQFYFVGGTQLGNSVLDINSDSFILLNTIMDECQTPRPYLQCIQKSGGMLWEQAFNDWITTCDQPIFYNPVTILHYGLESFMIICLVRPDQENSLTQLRFTIFGFDGEFISDNIVSATEWPYFYLTSANQINSTLVLSGNGTICNTYDIQVVKTDLQGNVIQSNCFGNQEWQQSEPICGGVLDTEGNQVIMYSRCENYQWVGEIEAKLHVLKVDSDDLSAIYDNPIDFDVFDNGLISTGAIFTAVKEVPQGGYVGTFYYYEPTYQYIHAGILKVTYDGQLDWVKLYSPPNDFEFNALYDITPTPDGGFAATGISSNNLTQKHWLLKIDSCGYEQPSGCPAVISVEEQTDTKVQLWPNPFHNLLKAVLPQDAKRVFITDMTGRIVFEEKLFYPNQHFDLSRIERGAYLLNVVCEDGRIIGQRIVKQ